MKTRAIRAVTALILILTAGGTGYAFAENTSGVRIPAQTVTAPLPGTIRVLYSLDAKQTDKEIIALIDAAQERIYFAIYTFTLRDIADALVAAKERGVDVRGIVDSQQSANSYGAPIIELLTGAGIPVVTEKHETGNGIMHIKALVTESAYAVGSYNWTLSATTVNDEILQIGTDETLRGAYETILKKLFEAYKNNTVAKASDDLKPVGTISYTEASKYVGRRASVQGTLYRAYTSKSGTVFLDFCPNYKTCPFTGVIFADDAKQFGDLSRYQGKTITLSGTISLYEGKAEIILSRPDQLSL